MGKIIGIDLGTSTSEVSTIKNGKHFIIPNLDGKDITPSVVGKTETGELIFGEEAMSQMILRPQDTAIEVKRKMGTDEKVKISGEEYSPEEVSAMLLKHLKGYAEQYLDEEVDRAVITVPAYFDDNQRRATVKAGEIAGLKVERIINEPTAAALTYGIDHLEDEAHVLVYDLGGGTLDVTVLEMFSGVLEVKASSGNNKLGGKDFDEKVMRILFDKFKDENSIDISQNILAVAKIKAEAEKCKIALSTENEYKIEIPFIAEKNGQPLALTYNFTREAFEDAIIGLIKSTEKQIELALSDAGLKKENIDQVLLVGGSTRIPIVQQFLKGKLGQEAKKLVDPDLSVALGAAIQAGIITEQFSQEEGILITDVCPYTLGVETIADTGYAYIEDFMSVIIPRNTTIPVAKEEIYSTIADFQEKVEINVYQGDENRASKNNFLGKFHLNDIPKALAGKEKIRIKFTYDVNGMLKVDGFIVSTGQQAGIEIETTGVKMQKEAVDLSKWQECPNKDKFKRIIKKAEKLVEKIDDGEKKEELEQTLNRLKKALVLGKDMDLLEDIDEELRDMVYDIEGL
jgi:molecular chaperone DnaK